MTEYIERSYIRKMAMLEMAYTMETETDAAVVLRMIDDAPAADVTPVVHARWIYVEETLATSSGYCCSACRRPRWLSPDVPEVFKYCPKCGAKMDGERKDGADG